MNLRNDPIAFRDFSINDFVTVKGVELPSGSIEATKVKKDYDNDETDKIRINGFIAAIDALLRTVTVNDTIVVTTGGTTFLDLNERPVAFEDFAVNDFVKAVGFPRPDGSLVASEIRLEEPKENCDRKFRGMVAEIYPATRSLVVGIVLVQTTRSTVFRNDDYRDTNREPFNFLDVRIGDFLEVKYCPNTGPPPIARSIKKVSKPLGSEPIVKGPVLEIDSVLKTMTVNTTLVTTTGATRFLDEDNSPIAFNDFSLRDFVEVKGKLLADPSLVTPTWILLASSIQKKNDDRECDFKIRGFITEVNALKMTIAVGLVMVHADATTFIGDDRFDQQISIGDLEIGDSVKVRYCFNAGVPLAREIVVKSDDDFDLDDDREVSNSDLIEISKEINDEGITIDFDGDGRTTPNDLFIISTKWKQQTNIEPIDN